LKCCQLTQQRLLAAECRVFEDNNTAEFHKLCRGIWQNLLQKNGGPAYMGRDEEFQEIWIILKHISDVYGFPKFELWGWPSLPGVNQTRWSSNMVCLCPEELWKLKVLFPAHCIPLWPWPFDLKLLLVHLCPTVHRWCTFGENVSNTVQDIVLTMFWDANTSVSIPGPVFSFPGIRERPFSFPGFPGTREWRLLSYYWRNGAMKSRTTDSRLYHFLRER